MNLVHYAGALWTPAMSGTGRRPRRSLPGPRPGGRAPDMAAAAWSRSRRRSRCSAPQAVQQFLGWARKQRSVRPRSWEHPPGPLRAGSIGDQPHDVCLHREPVQGVGFHDGPAVRAVLALRSQFVQQGDLPQQCLGVNAEVDEATGTQPATPASSSRSSSSVGIRSSRRSIPTTPSSPFRPPACLPLSCYVCGLASPGDRSLCAPPGGGVQGCDGCS